MSIISEELMQMPEYYLQKKTVDANLNQSINHIKESDEPNQNTDDRKVCLFLLSDKKQKTLNGFSSHQRQPNIAQQFLFRFYIVLNITCLNSLVLAVSDGSKPLNQVYKFTSLTFRKWLWMNFSLSILSIAFYLLVFAMKIRIKANFESKLMHLAMAIWSGKVIWVICGLVLLFGLDLKQCHNSVIMYSGAQFTAYVVGLGPLIKNIQKAREMMNQEQRPSFASGNINPSQIQVHRNLIKSFEIGKNFMKLFQRLPKLAAKWTIFTFILHFSILVFDDQSWLDENLVGMITFRKWLGIDLIMLILAVMVQLLLFDEWRLTELKEQLLSEEIKNNKLKFVLAVCILVAKISCAVIGSVFFISYVSIDRTRQVHYYLTAHFAGFHFILISLICGLLSRPRYLDI